MLIRFLRFDRRIFKPRKISRSECGFFRNRFYLRPKIFFNFSNKKPFAFYFPSFQVFKIRKARSLQN